MLWFEPEKTQSENEDMNDISKQVDDSEDSDVEGLDRDEDISFGDYPIDTVLIRNENRTVHDVLRRIEKGNFVMDPDFQRDFIWPEEKQCKLIESVMMRIPLPVFYLAENTKGQMIVVDGLQRLSTFQRFVNNELKLKLSHQNELHGKHFRDLSPKLQNRVEDCNLVLYIIDAKVPTQALLDIFEPVNGGVPLTRQQMRNCLYSGKSTQFLKAEAANKLFVRSTGGSLNTKTMRDRELINRYCAFELLDLARYKGDMDDFLAKALEEMNRLPNSELEHLSAKFRASMRNNYNVFGKHAFRKHQSAHDSRSVINASLWDVMSIGLSRYPESLIEANIEELRVAFYNLMKNGIFREAISLGTNQVNRVNARFKLAKTMLEEVLGDY
ncbi:hypothetical protein PSE10A_28740 [Pseudomonas amygdali pv. eriobotryae]|uniref:GmrSD restriction endonucleases N-terminal domain-containing protein n=1 Tax=Pseudomonas amygdali pv. eriobotryae TaxID=129137 RepID=A0A9P3AEN2_PSEA0|nr:DUF262 domain-containing protein [Pseudomonas amygdali]GFZ60363.1 hypothetical protein PSE10A_28740 [Pseudomonas amygdali pv. eriobotryae]